MQVQIKVHMRGKKGVFLSVLVFVILSAFLLLTRGLISKVYLHDTYYLVDAIWRSSTGQTPHVDFQTSIGKAFYWPYWLLSRISEVSILTVFHANVLVGSILLALALATLPRRLNHSLLVVAVATITAIAMSGRSIDFGFRTYDHVAPYNRWGWAFASLLALIVAIKPEGGSSKWNKGLDGAVIAICLATLFYLKVSFFLPSLVVCALAAALGALDIRTASWTIALLAALVVGVEASSGTVALYYHDLRVAVTVNAQEGYPLRLGQFIRASAVSAVYWLLMILIVLASTKVQPNASRVKLWWKPAAVITGIIGASAVIGVQTHPLWEVELLGTAMVILLEYVRRSNCLPHGGQTFNKGSLLDILRQQRSFRELAGVVALGAGLCLTLVQPVRDSASIIAHATESVLARNCKEKVFAGTPMENLLFPREYLLTVSGIRRLIRSKGDHGDFCAPGDLSADVYHAGEAKRLMSISKELRQKAGKNDVVLALDFANPYPFILRGPSPKRALLWFHRGRSYSTQVHPDPERLLSEVDFVVQTDYPVPSEAPAFQNPWLGRDGLGTSPVDSDLVSFGQDAWVIYGHEVRRKFGVVAEGHQFRIWERRVRNRH